MFKADLARRLKLIFGVSKVTFNAPDMDAPEQDCIFVEVVEAVCRMSGKDDGLQTAKVTGNIIMFSQAEKLPYGFFAKRVEQANFGLTKNFFFEKEIDVLNSPARLINISERRITFLFLYDAQYDPNRGELTSLETELEFNEG